MDIRAAEISTILKDQIANFGAEAEVTEVGKVLSVGDGIARVHGLDEVKAGDGHQPILKKGDAVRIFTGAPVPDTANAVIMQEKVSLNDNRINI